MRFAVIVVTVSIVVVDIGGIANIIEEVDNAVSIVVILAVVVVDVDILVVDRVEYIVVLDAVATASDVAAAAMIVVERDLDKLRVGVHRHTTA